MLTAAAVGLAGYMGLLYYRAKRDAEYYHELWELVLRRADGLQDDVDRLAQASREAWGQVEALTEDRNRLRDALFNAYQAAAAWEDQHDAV